MLAPWIISHFPTHNIYVEPFAGAASVLLRKSRSKTEIINDLDGRIVNLFSVLRDETLSKKLEKALYLTPYSRKEYELGLDDSAECPVERARRAIVRGCMSFGSSGLIDSNPGFRAKTYFCNEEKAWADLPYRIHAFTERLRGVVIESMPAERLLLKHDRKDTLFYLDPPYVHTTRTSYTSRHGYIFDMSAKEHRSLAKTLHNLKSMIIISGYDSKLYNKLFVDWPRFDYSAVAVTGSKRTECLWLSPRTYCALKDKKMPTLFENLKG